MTNLFSIFYAVLFGAVLSAEIGSNHFHLRYLEGSSLTGKVLRQVWRLAFLIVLRSFYFAWAYNVLSFCKGIEHGVPALVDTLASLGLCAPLFGIQQISYVIVGPPLTAPNTNPMIVTTRSDKVWWGAMGILFFLVPVVWLDLWARRYC